MTARTLLHELVIAAVCLLTLPGCTASRTGGGVNCDRPFPHGQVTDAHWDTQITNGEASDFVFYDHEFIGDTSTLNPSGQRHLAQIALRLDHVPFPVVIEESINRRTPQLDRERRDVIVARLMQLGYRNIECRVVVAPAIAEGLRPEDVESAYNSANSSNSNQSSRAVRR